MKTSDFDYTLPPDLIAQHPIEPRDASRLLVLDRASGQISHRRFSDLPEYVHAGDLLIGNNSRVIPARLHGAKPTGGEVEVFLLRPVAGQAVDEQGSGPGEARHRPSTSTEVASAWECLVRGKGLRTGTRMKVRKTASSAPQSEAPEITATILGETAAGGRVVTFDPPVEQWLWDVGEVPLPPYIHEALGDPERYQTVYSRIEGSVASSTAGLHFTPELLLALRGQGITTAFVTLHIGLDTFRPVQAENVEEHQIHSEWAEMPADTARAVNETRLAGGRIVAIGTTSVRVLESAAKIALGFKPGDTVPPDAVCGWRTVAAFTAETNLYITPGHTFRAVDALITNFHLPRSTLLMLVSAFAGPGLAGRNLILRAYNEAIRKRYRFYSFGDAMLIL